MDGILPKQLMETVEQVSIPLARVFNLLLTYGMVPFKWKEENKKRVQEISKIITDQ